MNTLTLKRLLSYISEQKLYLAGAIISAFISVAASLCGPMLIGKAIDKMISKNNVYFANIFKLLIILSAVYICNSIFVWLLTYFTNCISYRVVNKLRTILFDKLNTLPLNFFDRNAHGDIISRFVNDIDAVSDGMLQGISTLITGLATIAGAIGFMLYISPIMALVVVLSAPASYYMARFITKRSRQMYDNQAKSLGNLNGYIEEIIGGEKVVQAFNFQHKTYNEFKIINNELYNTGVKAQFYGSLSGPTTRLVNNITYSIIGVIGSVMTIMDKITVGDISSFLIYSNLFAKPFNEMTGVITQIQGSIASAKRLFVILDMEPETQDCINFAKAHNIEGKIEFKNVDFSYTKSKPLIKDFSLNVKAGSRIAIVGQTGAGKTTLVNLLMRFYDVTSGDILIDGINIKSMRRTDLRRSFGMVLQDTWLISGTIKDNIAYGKPNASMDEIIAAAKASNAHSFIRRLPNGYDTIIANGGENLSEGQRQLLTIARVMLVDPPMLILDEATSSIDTLTEINIQKAFLKMIEGRTSFVIAHRLSTIRDSDLILVMDSGNVVEYGNHKQLLDKHGAYYKLYNSQFSA